jgi:predicted acetyltransferase
MTEEYRLRAATNAEFDQVFAVLMTAFGESFEPDDVEGDRPTFEPDRSLVVTHADEIVACAGAYTRDLTVPGAVVPAAHVTYVGVLPWHRRRGLLTRMMTEQLRSVRAAGRESVAVLWASEGKIYQRFGYGAAAKTLSFEIDTREVRLNHSVPVGSGELRGFAPTDVVKEMQQVYERVRPLRPGWSSRPGQWWDGRLRDPSAHRHGASPKRALLYTDGDGPAGYAIWRTKHGWNGDGPNGETEVIEIVAATAEAYANLWRFLLSVDLMRSARYRHGALDEPLQYLVDEPRRLGARVADGLWVRVVDVAAALSARQYATRVDVAIDVTDALLPENAGRYRLRADGAGTAVCERTSADADLACDIVDLGTAYLGGVSLGALADAGRVVELRPGALGLAAAALSWHRAPSGIEVF